MPEITKTEDSTARQTAKYVWIILAILIVFVYFFGLTLPFLGPDEARYAQVAREMLGRGDWITPTLGGFNWFEKPALLYWLEMISYKLFGFNEFAARFGPALFGLGTIASLWILGRNLATRDTERSNDAKNFANWLALSAASTLGIIVFSRAASFDIIITFPITAALVSFYLWHSKNEAPPDNGEVLSSRVSASLVLFYVFTGVALIAKGLIGIVFPFAIVGSFYVLSRRLPSRTFVISLIWGTLLAAAIAAAWYLPMYLRHGYQFIDEFIIQHHFQRFTSNKYQHPQPFYFFLWVLPLMTLPWLPFFLAAIWKNVKGIFHRRDAETQNQSPSLFSSSPLLLFSVAWLLVPLVFFSFSGSKLPGYVLPSVPATAILTAIFVFELVRKSNRWRNAVLAVAASTFATTILLLVFVVPRFAEADSVRTLILAANDRGYVSNRVLTMRTVSHNAEFYAAGRLLRDETGKLRRLESSNEVLAEINAENGAPVLVLIPVKYLSQLTNDQRLSTAVLQDNGELTIAAVSLK